MVLMKLLSKKLKMQLLLSQNVLTLSVHSEIVLALFKSKKPKTILGSLKNISLIRLNGEKCSKLCLKQLKTFRIKVMLIEFLKCLMMFLVKFMNHLLTYIKMNKIKLPLMLPLWKSVKQLQTNATEELPRMKPLQQDASLILPLVNNTQSQEMVILMQLMMMMQLNKQDGLLKLKSITP